MCQKYYATCIIYIIIHSFYIAPFSALHQTLRTYIRAHEVCWCFSRDWFFLFLFLFFPVTVWASERESETGDGTRGGCSEPVEGSTPTLPFSGLTQASSTESQRQKCGHSWRLARRVDSTWVLVWTLWIWMIDDMGLYCSHLIETKVACSVTLVCGREGYLYIVLASVWIGTW